MGRGLLVLIAVFLFAGSALGQAANKVVLKDFRADGSLVAGGDFTITFRLRNIYDWELKDVNVQLEGGYPFLAESPATVGGESKLLPNSDSKPFSYTLRVDPAAGAGDYAFNIVTSFSAFTYNTESQPFENKIPVTLKVSGAPLVGAGLVSSIPAEVLEGQSVVLSVKAWNQGKDRARNVWLSAKDTKELDVAFASERIYVGDIESKGSKNVEISVKVQDEVPPDAYKLPVAIAYEGEDGKTYSKDAEFLVEVKKTADFEVTGVKQDELSAGQKDGLIEVTLRNKGTKAAKDIRLTLLAKYPFTPTGKTYYIGEIQPGEDKLASFHVDVDDQASVQNYPADLQVEWREDDTEKSSIERFALKTSPKKESTEDFWEKLWVKRDTRLLVGVAGILLFFILLSSFRKRK